MSKYFVATQILKDVNIVEIDGQPVIEKLSLQLASIAERCGQEVAWLFAVPRLTRGNGVAAARIDWYSHVEGISRPIADLDPGSRDSVWRKLGAHLSALAPLLDDRELGPFVSAALNVASPSAILSIGGEPLITQWGTLPAGAFADRDLRERLHRGTLGQFLPSDFLPPISMDEWRRAHPDAVQAGQGASSVHAATAAARYTVRQPRVLGPIIACCLAAFAAAVLYIPGVLIFPRGVDAEAAGRRSALLKDVLTQMQGRTSDLKALLQKDCNAIRAEIDGILPRQASDVNVTLPPLQGAISAPPMVGSPAAAPPPTDPAAVQPADASAPPPGPIDLASRAERGVVLVVAKESTGSGFFVSPDTIVTNRHVVVEEPDGIQIVSKYVGVLPAKVVDLSNDETMDFAILRVAPQNAVAPFALTTRARKLEQVVSAGFPGVAVRTDPAISSVLAGDQSGLSRVSPNMAPGSVMNVQQQSESLTLMVHTATIAPGNSGGPLLDLCGRVIGVNTFVIIDQKVGVPFFYALGSDGLKAYLAKNGFTPAADDTECNPQVAPLLPAQVATMPVPTPTSPDPAVPTAPTTQKSPPSPTTPAPKPTP